MKLQDLDGWPPQPSGAYDRSFRSPLPEDAIIEKVIYQRGHWLTFMCRSEGDLFAYDFEAKYEKTVEDIAAILEARVGKNLLSIADIDLPGHPPEERSKRP